MRALTLIQPYLCEEWLPARIVRDELGDTVERCDRLQRRGAGRLRVLAAGLWGGFWLVMNAVRLFVGSARGGDT